MFETIIIGVPFVSLVVAFGSFAIHMFFWPLYKSQGRLGKAVGQFVELAFAVSTLLWIALLGLAVCSILVNY